MMTYVPPQKSFLLFGPPGSGKYSFYRMFVKSGAKVQIFDLRKHLIEFYKRSNDDVKISNIRNKVNIQDDLFNHVLSHEIKKLSNSAPIFVKGFMNTPSKIEIVKNILMFNEFSRPTIISLDCSKDYCMGRLSRDIEEGKYRNISLKTFEKKIDKFYSSKNEMFQELREQSLRIYKVEDYERSENLNSYARDLNICLNPQAKTLAY